MHCIRLPGMYLDVTGHPPPTQGGQLWNSDLC